LSDRSGAPVTTIIPVDAPADRKNLYKIQSFNALPLKRFEAGRQTEAYPRVLLVNGPEGHNIYAPTGEKTQDMVWRLKLPVARAFAT
jgi:hypothetical protein